MDDSNSSKKDDLAVSDTNGTTLKGTEWTNHKKGMHKEKFKPKICSSHVLLLGKYFCLLPIIFLLQDTFFPD
jgi:hypothetical protein